VDCEKIIKSIALNELNSEASLQKIRADHVHYSILFKYLA